MIVKRRLPPVELFRLVLLISAASHASSQPSSDLPGQSEPLLVFEAMMRQTVTDLIQISLLPSRWAAVQYAHVPNILATRIDGALNEPSSAISSLMLQLSVVVAASTVRPFSAPIPWVESSTDASDPYYHHNNGMAPYPLLGLGCIFEPSAVEIAAMDPRLGLPCQEGGSVSALDVPTTPYSRRLPYAVNCLVFYGRRPARMAADLDTIPRSTIKARVQAAVERCVPQGVATPPVDLARYAGCLAMANTLGPEYFPCRGVAVVPKFVEPPREPRFRTRRVYSAFRSRMGGLYFFVRILRIEQEGRHLGQLRLHVLVSAQA